MTFKKNAHAAEQERPGVAARRQTWFAAQPDLDPQRLVFIDETDGSTKIARLRGRARRGERCRAAVPHGYWMTTFTGLRDLPPLPDFNPIENASSKLKAILRKDAARSITDLWDVIRDTLPRFTPHDCINYFTAAGYERD